ncbi:8-oxoguanine DNA glycosylase OGG fold protein [Streptomyces sp. NPDC004008]
MLERPLPSDAVGKLGAWLAGDGARYADGTGLHAVRYVPASWEEIRPWPSALSGSAEPKPTALSRAQVLEVARAGANASRWTETLVAGYVWGQGDNGYGAYRLGEILRDSSVEAVLGRAVAVLADEGAVAAYRRLRGAIRGLGPAFFTKFLYFVGGAIPDVPGPRPLVLDQRIARVVRAYATQVGEEAGLEQPARLATWLWSDGGWTPHRYGVYLRWMHGATEQLARSTHWPPTPDLLELALFSGAWTP